MREKLFIVTFSTAMLMVCFIPLFSLNDSYESEFSDLKLAVDRLLFSVDEYEKSVDEYVEMVDKISDDIDRIIAETEDFIEELNNYE